MSTPDETTPEGTTPDGTTPDGTTPDAKTRTAADGHAPIRRTLVTGGAGFIGSALVRALLATGRHEVVTLDALTYAGHRASLAGTLDDPRHTFVHGDVADAAFVDELFDRVRPDAVLHLAAESHVDRSIDAPGAFLRTNVDGTFVLLQAARRAWVGRDDARFVHVST
ncbi:MAG: GDP-mannose 4,6-dehydratase, partial [Trueperaceae bacterium]